MYKNYFGLKESPFQLVPNPAYLFLSKSHEEALAHLTYAIRHGDGFVLITGEVGTGKTTLCRAFLDNLGEDIEAAYIFNPHLNSIELLKAINEEFGIDSTGTNHKELIDVLNTFLMEKKSAGKKVILLIDEAQNLSTSVLEELRLLSNLETNVSKLLQIILVGQPELGGMLASYRLRQLAQRITLSCIILPLNFKDCQDYIQHRIHIASQGTVIKFTKSALRSIYRYSRGIPRRINIVCDRALLTAYGLDHHQITGAIAKSTIHELTGSETPKLFRFTKGKAVGVLLPLLGVILLYVLLYPPEFISFSDSTPAEINKRETTPLASSSLALNKISQNTSLSPEKISSEMVTQSNSLELPPSEPTKSIDYPFSDYLALMDGISMRKNALQAILSLWSSDSNIHPSLESIERDEDYFRIAAKQKGFSMTKIDCDIERVKHLNLPVIMSVKTSEGMFVEYLTLFKIEDNQIRLIGKNSDETIKATLEEIRSYCTSPMYVLWKDFYTTTGTIKRNASADSVMTLKLMLKEIGFNDIEMSPIYDKATEHAVKTIQQKHHIPVDGIVGNFTKMVLYNELGMPDIPHLSEKPFNEHLG